MRTLAILNAFGWVTLLIAQGSFVSSALFSGYEAGLLWRMSAFMLVSSLKVVLFGTVGLALSAALLSSGRRAARVPRGLLWALAALSVLALWNFCLSGLSLYWRAPLGDGTFTSALTSFARVNYGGSFGAVVWRLWQQLFLCGSGVVWLVLAVRPPGFSLPPSATTSV